MRIALSLLLVCLLATTATAQNIEKKARKFIKKFGLEEQEVYHVSNKVFASKYADEDGAYSFLVNFLYDKGKEVRYMLTKNGTIFSPFTCFQTLVTDLDTVMMLTVMDTVFGSVNGRKPVVIDSLDMSWANEHMQPVFTTDRKSKARYRMVIYFPIGLSVMYKRVYPYYDDLIKRVKHYDSRDIELYFVLVPILSKK